MNEQLLKKFYMGLRAFDSFSFPKTCSKCGKKFLSFDKFLEETENAGNHQSGLSEFDMGERVTVGLFRNCTCHTTLFSEFSNRRDDSDKGKQRRNEFKKLLQILEKEGLNPEEGTNELRKVIRGEDSEILDRMGVILKPIGKDV